MAEIRPMESADVEVCERTWHESWLAMRRHLGLPGPEITPHLSAEVQAGIRHLLASDPGRSLVAKTGGEVVGLAQGLVRGGVWVLSLLGVLPEAQGDGLGRRLLEAALDTREGLPGIIICSQDPRAMRLYASAGFDLHPATKARGYVRPDALPEVTKVSIAGPESLGLVAETDRRVNGTDRSPDVEHLLTHGAELLCHDDGRGYAVASKGSPALLAADDEEAATELLFASLARARPGADEVAVRPLTAGHQWAIDASLRAGLDLTSQGPVMLRGLDHVPTTYLPSSIFG